MNITTQLTGWHLTGYERAVKLWQEERVAPKCPGVYKKTPKNRSKPLPGERCWSPAGKGTWHVGYGHCVAHGGAKREGRSEGAWLMAHAFAEEYDVTPWEALLLVVRITAGRVRYCEQVLATATSDAEIEGRVSEGEPTGVSADGQLTQGRNLSWWVETSERERMMLAKVSKAAIDAGVAQIMLQREIEAGENMAMILGRTLDALDNAGVPQETLAMIRGIMGQELRALELEGSGPKTIEG